METIVGYSKCICGAITVYTEAGESFSCKRSIIKKFFPNMDLRTLRKGRLTETYCCDHCVNHYGLDLCGCGSGQPFGKCKNGFEECVRPMQKLGKYTSVRARDSLMGRVA